MADETWHAARLISTSGIAGSEEQERRATSALLAVMPAVKEFSKVLLNTSVPLLETSRHSSKSLSNLAT
jgi:hypothetical protein